MNDADRARGGVVTAADEAQRMIDAFASVGANRIHVTKTDINGIAQWGKAYSLEDLRRVLPPMVRVAGQLEDCDILEKKTKRVLGRTRAGGNLMVRPFSDTTAFIQLDDLTEEKLERVRPVSFLTVRTSPGNQQAWIAVPAFATAQGRKDFISRVKEQVTSDVAASGSVRLAGTSNFKPKYIGNFPQVAIIDTAPGRMTTPEALEALGLVTPPKPYQAPAVVPFTPSLKHSRSGKEPEWPDYGLCLQKAPRAGEGGPDRSKADFFWCMMAAQRGWSAEAIANKLLEVSEKAQEKARFHDEGYALVTAQNAADAAERGRKRGRG